MRRRPSSRGGALLVLVLGIALSLSACSSGQRVVLSGQSWWPLDNDCSSGRVVLTFDGGPGVHTLEVMRSLQRLHLQAVFFAEGQKLHADPQARETVRTLAAAGFPVENDTFDHRSFTGSSTHTTPLTPAQVGDELTRATAEITAAGLPRPTLYRPPYGDIDAQADIVARDLGYRVVMPWGTPSSNILDSRAWDGSSAAQVVDRLTRGRTTHGVVYRPVRDGTVIAMSDGGGRSTSTAINALPPLVDWLNAQHLCTTDVVPADATGGVVPVPAPRVPRTGNLVRNASLEARRHGGSAGGQPRCFERAGVRRVLGTARWGSTGAARSGHVAQILDVTRWSSGDRKLLLSRRASDARCLAPAHPGRRYRMWVHYRGSWSVHGAGAARVSMVAYYRDRAGRWRYWTGSTSYPPTTAWNLAYLQTPPLPLRARAVSFGLALRGRGSLVTDDYAMTTRRQHRH